MGAIRICPNCDIEMTYTLDVYLSKEQEDLFKKEPSDRDDMSLLVPLFKCTKCNTKIKLDDVFK